MKKKKHNWLKRIVLGQCILSTALNIIAIGIVGYDIIMFAVEGLHCTIQLIAPLTTPYSHSDLGLLSISPAKVCSKGHNHCSS